MTSNPCRYGLVLLVSLCAWPAGPAWAQRRGAAEEAAPDDAAKAPAAADSTPAPTPEDERERKVMERFLGLLEKAPRRGTALDRVYGYHVERGTLDAFVKGYEDRVAKDPKDGAAWLILGLVESQRGRDAAAVTALRQAEAARPSDPLPSYYLGQALVLVGQPDAAAEAFERAIARKPPRTDLLEAFQALGRVHQRAHRNEQALAVWKRLEQLFPDDLRVQEQIATALAEESQPALALDRYEALAKKTTDDYRKVQFKIEAADLKVRLARTNDALADFEALLGQLNPESWLHREVRRRIEDVFLRNDDQAGLAKYYESWIKKTPDDVDAMARLGRSLAGQGRIAEAQSWFDRAVKLAPSRKELRLALVEQLVHDKKFAEAAAQYEAMAKTDPNNPDTLREWGKLILKDTARLEADRKQAAAAVWKRMVDARPKDAATAVQVADLSRQAGLTEEAIALYKKAIALDPASPQYHEYLGEYYHNLKRTDDALATWSALAAGPNRSAKNLGRLAEVEAGFGYRKQALEAIAEACKLDTESFDLQIQYADLLHAADRFDDALRQLDLAAKAADDDEQREAVLDRQIKNYQASNTLEKQIDALRSELQAGTTVTAERWRRLARFWEAAPKLPEATQAIKQALALEPNSVPAWVVAARLHETSGNLGAAADAYRRLAELDRRARTDYLMNVAKLEVRLGRREQAIKAGRDLLAAAPGNVENYQFFADLCFQIGQTEEGLDVLRRAVRLNEADPKALLSLAETLSQQFRTDESIEMFWRAFEKTSELDAKLGIVSRLASLYLQRNQFDRLTNRLERMGREADQQREMSICLAQAYASSGDFGTAREELERLLTANTRDTQLLTQLSALAENEGDTAAAAKYQRQLLDIAPSDEGSSRLAQLYVRAGEVSEAEVIWSRLAAGEPESHQVLLAIDSLLAHDKAATVLGITEGMLRKQPGNWEALYREGRALVELQRPAEALARFQALLDVKAEDGDQSVIVKARTKGPAGRPAGSTANQPSAFVKARANPLQSRMASVQTVRIVTGLETRYGGTPPSWSPSDFGQARIGALAWQFALGEKNDTQESVVKRLRDACAKAPADPRPFWDLFYLQTVRQEYPEVFEAAKALSRAAPTDLAAQWAFLSSLPNRATHGQNGQIYNPNSGEVDSTPALPAEELDHVLATFHDLKRRKPEWVTSPTLTSVTTELKRAHRADLADRFYHDALEAATDADSAANVLQLAADRGDVENILKLFDAYERLRGARAFSGAFTYTFYGGFYAPPSNPTDSLGRAMCVRADAKAHADVLRLLDRYLVTMRKPEQASTRARSRFSTGNQGGVRFQMWSGKNAKSVHVDFPAPNAYFDIGGIQLLRTAFEIYKRDDLLSDLLAHLRKPLSSDSAADKLYAHLALCYVNWWNEEQDEALRELTEAAATAGSDPELSLNLAELRAQRNEPEEALAAADAFEPLDQKGMQRRELLALRLAVLVGNVERARRAAERLFGLRLDAETQVQLAAQMHQLGMHELAEAILARARRRAGNNANALVGLMLQYQNQNNMDVAVQVAHQILRRNMVRQFSPYYNDSDAAEHQAISVLARSGKLKETIARLEAQVEHSPSSVSLQQVLADYYKAAGEKDKVKAVYDRILKLKPEDAKLRYQVGMNLLHSGETEAAIDHLKVALRKDPSLLGYQYWEIQNAFQQVNRFDELVDIVEQVDIKAIRQPWEVAQMVQRILQDRSKRDRGLALLRKAWKAFPRERAYLLSNLQNDEILQLPEMYDFVQEEAVPPSTRASVAPWEGVDTVSVWMGQGKVLSNSTRMLEIATKQGKLEPLAREIEAAVKRLPEWLGGKALLALIQARRGRVDQAREQLQVLIAASKEKPMPAQACMIIGQEVEEFAPLLPLAVELYENALHSESSSIDMEFEFSPIRRLVSLYKRAGRAADARREMLKFLARKSDRYNYDPGYAAYRRLNSAGSVGQTFLELGFPADAARYYSDVLADAEMIENASRFGGRMEWELKTIRDGLRNALQGLNDETVAETVRTLLQPVDPPSANGQVLDLVLLLSPREVDRATITSMLASALHAGARSRDVLDPSQAAVTKLLEAHPHDLSVQVAAALVAFETGKAEGIDQAVTRLLSLVDELPLEDLPAGTRANSRQRADAARQLGLWLVARACLDRESTRAQGERLAARAIEAGRRQTDTVWGLAMLREWGQHALDHGDRAAAEKRWSQMLDLVLAAPQTPRTTASASMSAAPATRPLTALTPARATTTSTSPAVAVPPARASASAARLAASAPASTVARFELAAGIAWLAATHDMPALSLRAIREPLRGGPPVQPMAIQQQQQARMVRVSNGNETTDDRSGNVAVERSLGQLEPAWHQRKAPAGEVYETLRLAVLPDARPGEVFLYPHSLAQNGAEHPRSAGAMLARWAVRAGKADDLRGLVEPRRQQSMAEVPATVLLAQLAVEKHDHETANRLLQELDKRLDKDTLQNTAELACHAALPAIGTSETEKAALAVVEHAIKNLASAPGEEPAGSLIVALARHHFKAKREDDGRKQIQAYAALLERALAARNDRGGGGDAAQLRRMNHLKAANELARAGLGNDTLEALGQYVDAPRPMYEYGNQLDSGRAFTTVVRMLSALPARERYDRLKAWTLPTSQRPSVRILAGSVTFDVPPEAFGAQSSARDLSMASTATMLIDAAREAGTLDDLAAEVQQAADRKLDHARTLRILVQIARGQTAEVEPDLRQMLAEWSKKPENNPNNYEQPKDVWPGYLIVHACLADPKLADLGRLLARHFPAYPWNSSLSDLLHRDTVASEVMREGGTPLASYQGAGPALWTASDLDERPGNTGRMRPAAWVASDGHIARAMGVGNGALVFNIPLAGTFEFSVDSYMDATASGQLGYGGAVIRPSTAGMANNWQNGTITFLPSSSISSVDGRDSLGRSVLTVASGAYNRLAVQVEPGKVRYLINGHLYYEDRSPSPTSPWITLGASPFAVSVADFRNISLTGSPQIPDHVALSQGDRLDGWVGTYYNETTPARLNPNPTASLYAQQPAQPTLGSHDERDWTAKDGVIEGRLLDSAERYQPVQSRLYYHRPMRDGETISYEFLYEPGAIAVHPALDRLAFLIEPDGVRLHWMTEAGEVAASGLEATNVADEPANCRGAVPLPLKPGAWNAVALGLRGSTLTISLNDAVIYERSMEADNCRLFGFYHDKALTAARIRNVVLRGDWPRSLSAELLAKLAAPVREAASPADRRAAHAMAGESLFSRDAELVLKQARALPADKRYDRLADWVLPSDDHPVFRLAGAITPTDPAPPARSAELKLPEGATRVETGGALEAPALDLVAAAKDAGKLDALAERVKNAPTADDADRRGQLALRALVAAAQGQDADAEQALRSMKPLLEKVAPEDPEWQRWPDLIAAAGTLDRPALREAARALLDYIATEQLQKEHKGVSALWRTHLAHLRGRADWLALGEAERGRFGTDPALAAWARVSHARAQTRGLGYPRAFWLAHKGALRHFPGHEHDFVYLRTPITGDFEVACELFGEREVQLGYGALVLGLSANRKEYSVSEFGRQPRTFTLNPPLELNDKSFRFRIVVEAGSYTAYVNDRKIHEAGLSSTPDPWLVVYQAGADSGGVRNLTIKGHPTTPEQIELASQPELGGWFSEYEEPNAPRNENTYQSWQKRGDEITNKALEKAEGSKQESLLTYHRPMLEDGEIQYEFYYEPGKTLVHPALGRAAFYLQPDGVKIHWLTDSPYDRTGLAPENLHDEPANRRRPASLPLRAKAWNRLALRLEGDRLSLRLNEELIYESPLDHTNARTFSLFHYADETGVRVRNVVYRGRWPRTLPADLGLGADAKREVSLGP